MTATAVSSGNHPVPPISNLDDPIEQFRAFVELVQILHIECPWDKEQTHTSLMPLLIEEVYEAQEAADAHDAKELSKELGDVLLHVVMNGVIAEEAGTFTLAQVLNRVREKLIHRHPHVFGSVAAGDANAVKVNWEQLKMQEGRTSVLEGVPKHLPALLRAQRTQEKASRVGFDWDNAPDVWKKVEEELAELHAELTNQESSNQAAVEEEFGDVMFALVNAARFQNLNAEQALQHATSKFTKRFQRIEQMAAAQGKALNDMTLAEMDELWNEAKRELRITN